MINLKETYLLKAILIFSLLFSCNSNLNLAKDEYTIFNASDPENTTVDNNYTEKDFGKIKLSNFDINIENKSLILKK